MPLEFDMGLFWNYGKLSEKDFISIAGDQEKRPGMYDRICAYLDLQKENCFSTSVSRDFTYHV